MKGRWVQLNEKIIGEIIAQDVYNHHGRLIVAKNTTINAFIVKRIKDFGVFDIYIYSPSNTIEKGKHIILEKLKENYKENVTFIKDMLNNIAIGKKIDIQKIAKRYDCIYPQYYENNYVVACMNELQGTDEYTYTHSMNVSLYALLIGRWLKLNDKQIEKVALAGFLHDIGKGKIPCELLNKKGRLLPGEFEEVKKHTIYGYEISKSIPDIDEEVRQVILMHHEREDGKGYPFGVNRKEIHLYTKIISIADVYDALTSKRAYKEKMTPFDTFREMTKFEYGHLDKNIMLTFLHNIVNYYVGAKVKMNSGEVAQIICIPYYNSFKPIVMIKDKIIDLSKNNKYEIIEMI